MSSMQIVLVDPLGEVLFSGESLIARSPEELPEALATPIAASVAAIAAAPDSSEVLTEPEFSDHDLESQTCPETMRSAGSGVFRAVDPASEVPRVPRLRAAG